MRELLSYLHEIKDFSLAKELSASSEELVIYNHCLKDPKNFEFRNSHIPMQSYSITRKERAIKKAHAHELIEKCFGLKFVNFSEYVSFKEIEAKNAEDFHFLGVMVEELVE